MAVAGMLWLVERTGAEMVVGVLWLGEWGAEMGEWTWD